MTKLVSAVMMVMVVMALAASNVAAQPVPGELPLANFLEKRVPEELAAEGQLLSRQNLALQVEQAGPVLIVSLVALDTGHVAASTKVDQVPPDREAAVASITHVAADLIVQLAGRPSVSTDTQALIEAQRRAIDDERQARQQDRQAAADRELAQLKYQKEMIRFTDTYNLVATKNNATLVRNWVPYRGELEQQLAPHAFYDLVGRPDLADEYDHRHHLSIGFLISGGAALVATTVLFAQLVTVNDNCPIDAPDFASCSDRVGRERIGWAVAGLATSFVAVGLVAVGWHYQYSPHPISEDEAKSLAAAYNDGLRRNYGLPIVKRPLLRDVRIAPYVASNQGGLSLGGRF